MTGYIAEMRKLVGHKTIMQCAASIMCVDGQGRLLLGRRTDNHLWGYSGGGPRRGRNRILRCQFRAGNPLYLSQRGRSVQRGDHLSLPEISRGTSPAGIGDRGAAVFCPGRDQYGDDLPADPPRLQAVSSAVPIKPGNRERREPDGIHH